MRINEVLSCLRSTYNDWPDLLLVNPQFIRKNNGITWPNGPWRILKYPIRRSDITEMAEAGHYTFQIVEDGALIQIYYKYRKNKLMSASLAYYSAHPLEESSEEIYDVGAQEEWETSQSSERPDVYFIGDAPISWFRIDFSPQTARGILHHDCHMHICSFPNSRVVVSGSSQS